ncbi:hypothetical protein C1646_768942 [Rhizophagus diaphanus]|nr:hypothetical protein C1646_768942 [Rhizophagus diaphanus] [Rhizophagus sp. MUCL 43196]
MLERTAIILGQACNVLFLQPWNLFRELKDIPIEPEYNFKKYFEADYEPTENKIHINSTLEEDALFCEDDVSIIKIFHIDILDNIDHVSSFKQPLDLEKDGINPRIPEDKVAVFSKCIARNESSFSPLECILESCSMMKNESIPDVPSNIAEEIVKYGNKNLRELRKEVLMLYLPDNIPYDSSQHHDLEWIQHQ